MLNNPLYYLANKVALIHEEKVLILNEKPVGNWKGGWDLPGGRVDEEEGFDPFPSAIFREVVEETGIELQNNKNPPKLIGPYVHNEFFIEGSRLLMLLWKVEIDSFPDIILSHEHSEYRWLAIEELYKIDGWRNNMQEMVRDAFKK